MTCFLNSVSFDRLLWLVPIFFTIHNIEEAPFMERWSKRLPLKVPLAVTTRQFIIAVTILTFAGFAITFFAVEYLRTQTGYLLVLGIQAILLVNAFVPHIASTIRYRMYSPGLATAVLITLPFSSYLFRRALDENIISGTQLWIIIAMAPLAMMIFAYLSLQIGKVLDK